MPETIMRFMACSDLHYKDEQDCVEKKRFEEGLRQLYAYADSQPYKNVDAVYIVGDFATSGSMVQMESVKESLDRGIRPGTVVTLNLASHEWFGEGGEKGGRERFAKVFAQDADTHLVIGGFHFVSVSCTEGCHFRDPQQAFVSKALEEAHRDDPRKPIFFFQHPHPTNTVYGSIAWGCADLMPILVNYPQLITFSGHSHAPINDPRSIHQEHFTSVGTGTFSYFELDEFDKPYGTFPPLHETAAQMQIVEAMDDGSVRILPWDVIAGRPFPGLEDGWIIERPWDPDSFVYTREKRERCTHKPSFSEDAGLELSIKDGTLHLAFDHAKCPVERVNDYVITIKDADGNIERRLTLWSPFYVTEMPERMTWDMPAPPAGEYTVEICARGFWHNPSENTLTGSFTVHA
ncbi:MAG: metallophosphoesterase [Clostridia bacterium]|nr:metallophosphoesterase [Clostridia bacterium]